MIRQLELESVRHDESLRRSLRALSNNGSLVHWLDWLQVRSDCSAIVFMAGEIGWSMAYKHFDTPADVLNLGVYVREDQRRKGIGRALVQAVVDVAPDCKFAYSSQSPEARGMYAHFENDPRFHRKAH